LSNKNCEIYIRGLIEQQLIEQLDRYEGNPGYKFNGKDAKKPNAKNKMKENLHNAS